MKGLFNLFGGKRAPAAKPGPAKRARATAPARPRPTRETPTEGHRICVIGSSHMVAYKLAADEMGARDGLYVHFQGMAGREFAAIEARPKGVRVDPEKLLTDNRNARPMWNPLTDVIRYEEFDAFVVVGTLRTNYILSALYAHATSRAYTRGYIESGVEMMIERDHGVTLGRAIRKASGKPVVALAAPLPAIPVTVEDQAAMDAAYTDAIALIESAFKERGLATLAQPVETVVDSSSTSERFARASQTLAGVAHEEEERVHMNLDFGMIALPAILEAAGAPPRAVGPASGALGSNAA